MSDVVVVLTGPDPSTINACLAKLKELGLAVDSINSDQGVIEGSIEADCVAKIKTIPGVSYVRSVFTYTADFPPGDPRDKDGVEPQWEDDED